MLLGFAVAAQGLLDRHPHLRSAFRQRKTGGVVALVPRKVVELPWREVELTDEVRWRVIDADRAASFDPGQPPMMRGLLVRLPDRVVFVLTHHHLLLDGWSVPLRRQGVLRAVRRAQLPPRDAVPGLPCLVGETGHSGSEGRLGLRRWKASRSRRWSVASRRGRSPPVR